MELPLFHGQPVYEVRIPEVPSGFHLVEAAKVPYEVYLEFFRWGWSIRLYEEFVARRLISEEFGEYDYFVPTETGWRHFIEQAASEPEDLTALRSYMLGNFYLREENYVLFRLKFEGASA